MKTIAVEMHWALFYVQKTRRDSLELKNYEIYQTQKE